MPLHVRPARSKPSGCAGCPLETIGTGYAPADGPSTSRLVFIAEALGAEEAKHGRPLMGAAGGVHTRLLHRAGLSRDLTRGDNVCRCMPPGLWLDPRAPWYYPALSQCRSYLEETLRDIPPEGVVVTYGVTALKSLLQLHGVAGVNLQHFHGTVNRSPDDRYWIVPTFHPAHLLRGAMSLFDVVTQDLQRAARISQDGFQRSPSHLIVDPEPAWFRRWVDTACAAIAHDPNTAWLALDTEFAEKADGADESEVAAWDRTSPITRVNVSSTVEEGITVPYRAPYDHDLQRLFTAITQHQGWVFLWNKYADLEHLWTAGHTLPNHLCVDLMWAWHYLQSDLPRSLGFVAPFASDFGPWKHWAADRTQEGPYAAADALQTFRIAVWVVTALQQAQLWEVFLREWHERDAWVLRPAHDLGVPIDRPALEGFHTHLQQIQTELLAQIAHTTADGVLRPPRGYTKKPKTLSPPASMLGRATSHTKQRYLQEGATLVERQETRDVRWCLTCQRSGVTATHRCRKGDNPTGAPPVLVQRPTEITIYYWQLPYNPDARTQLLTYLDTQQMEAPVDRKTGRATTSAKALKALRKRHAEDPLLALQLEWRAVGKVDSTYVLGTLALLDHEDRIHPEILPKPSTLRDSAQHPNIQNVVAGRGEEIQKMTLAAGFRRCIMARDGLPSGADLDRWTRRWGHDAP